MSESAAVRRIRGVFLEPASNFHLCGLISLAAAVLLIVEVSLLPSKGSFVLAAVPTAAAALTLVRAVAAGRGRRLDMVIARIARSVGLTVRPERPFAASVFAVNFGLTNPSGNDFFDNRGSTFARPIVTGFTQGLRPAPTVPPAATDTTPPTATVSTTTPSPMPSECAATRSAAKRSMVAWWMPNFSGPLRASPESLTITRR